MTIDLTRRDLMMGLAALGLAGQTKLALAQEKGLTFDAPQPFSFDRLVERARQMAAEPYVPEVPRAADILERIDFDQHWRIKFKSEDTLELNNGKAPIRFFFLGRYFKLPVGIHVVENGEARTLRYDPNLFQIPR